MNDILFELIITGILLYFGSRAIPGPCPEGKGFWRDHDWDTVTTRERLPSHIFGVPTGMEHITRITEHSICKNCGATKQQRIHV